MMTRRSALAIALLAIFCLLTPAHASWPPPVNDSQFDYTDPTNWPNDPSFSGQWEMWSFVPTALRAQVDPLTKMLGTGAHYDQAWAKTTGDPRIIIAYTDSGLEWAEPELINKVYLNAGELPPPMAPCPGADGVKYDVNGDGRFNVQDYTTATGHMLPAAAMACDPRVSDSNKNGVIDAEDLIVAFSDGKDSDGNGYVDDISGWDFFH